MSRTPRAVHGVESLESMVEVADRADAARAEWKRMRKRFPYSIGLAGGPLVTLTLAAVHFFTDGTSPPLAFTVGMVGISGIGFVVARRASARMKALQEEESRLRAYLAEQ